jgi:DNA-binding beta-propeller fold protein YncE
VDTKTNTVYVADPRNKRIERFDSKGNFIGKWSVPEWGEPAGFEDLVVDSNMNRLYASSAHMTAVLMFDLNGNRIGTLTPKLPDKLDGPSALALRDHKLYVLNMVANRVTVIDL